MRLDFRLDQLEHLELLLVHKVRRAGERAGAVAQLGEGHHVAQRAAPQQQHGQPVEAKGEAGVRGCAVAESVDHKAEAGLNLFRGKAQGLEHALLHLPVVDAHRTAAQLHAVEHRVVSLRPHPRRVAFQVGKVLLVGHGEGVMHGHKAVFFFGKFKLGKVGDEQEVELLRVAQIEQVGHAQAELPEHAARHIQFIGAEQNQIALLRPGAREDGREGFFRKILGQNGIDAAVAPQGNPGHALGPKAHRVRAELVDHRAREGLAALGVDGAHHAAAFHALAEHGKRAVAHEIGHVHNFHAKARVGFVGAV